MLQKMHGTHRETPPLQLYRAVIRPFSECCSQIANHMTKLNYTMASRTRALAHREEQSIGSAHTTRAMRVAQSN